MSERLARGVYRAATWLMLPLAFGYFWLRGRREPAYRKRWRERLGYLGVLPHGAVWIHAASVGEVALAEPLVRALAARTPGQAIVITTFTPTGAGRVEARLADVAVHRYLPLDTHAATQRFMQRLQPRFGIIMETELWPNLLAAAARADVPVVVANASISARSTRRYRWPGLAALMRPALAGLAGIGAATSEHAERFAALGARADRIRVTGNLKFDVMPDSTVPSAGKALRREWQAMNRPVWVAASTHDGEESAVLSAHRALRAHCAGALLILAPRHPQRFDEIRHLLQREGWCFAARSAGEAVDEQTEVVLGDTLGDVPLFYALADIAFVGGSLVPAIGGHNVLEAAALARPIIVGPHTGEWQDAIDPLAASGALHVVADAPALAACLECWIEEPAAARIAGDAARACFDGERGAVSRLIRLLDENPDIDT